MSPGIPHTMLPNDPNYRHSPTGTTYPQQPPAQHVQSGPQYAYQNQNIQQRPPMGEMQLAEGGMSQAHAHAIALPIGSVPEPRSHSMVELGRRYTLDVVQQPKRARMCGFGDKDRRPITPPPCIRIVITDATTGAEIDTNEIGHTSFVLNVDLWSADGLREVNLVRPSNTSPPGTSYAPVTGIEAPAFPNPSPTGAQDPQYSYHYSTQNPGSNQGQQYNPYPGRPQINPYGQQQGNPPGQYSQQQPGGPPNPGNPPPQQQSYPPSSRYAEVPSHPGYYHPGARLPNTEQPIEPAPDNWNPNNSPTNIRAPVPSGATIPTGMFTRNLIGSLAASAFRLTDPNHKIGIWFILQDLSVRTEGHFRLRFSFLNVGPPSLSPNGSAINQLSILNTGKAPILASCFSDVFQVYSAKKFPGVVESTGLSRCFANQGIKIPIRKDGNGTKREDEDDED